MTYFENIYSIDINDNILIKDENDQAIIFDQALHDFNDLVNNQISKTAAYYVNTTKKQF